MGKLHLNFRDETVWRGRMLSHVHAIRCTLFEIGGWFAAIQVAYQFADYKLWVISIATAACFRMFGGAWDSWRLVRRDEKEVSDFMGQTYL
jgi:hypothetical protein